MGEHYFLMNDIDSNPFLPGVFDVIPGRNIPVPPSEYSFPPADIKKIKNKDIYFNFNEVVNIEFDYREEQGHIFSEQFMSVVSSFKSAPKIDRPLSIWMAGEERSRKFYYIAFCRGRWDKGSQLDENLIFYDRAKSVHAVGRLKGLVPIGEIVLTDIAKQYDYFELLDATCLSRFIVVNERVKNALEKASCLKGFKIVPLQEGFAEYCKMYRKSVEELLPKTKKRIP